MTDIVVITIICMHNMGYDDKKNVYSVLSDIFVVVFNILAASVMSLQE